ncbi:MAG TPA: diguanylate cyclase [Thermoanaerobaculia bacterium]|nr:diguanylate cyclase [Thermoanaerobaculia bacterium]
MPPAGSPAARRRILIVEDDPATRAGLEGLLGDGSSDVATAASLDEGRRALARFDPDICLTDLALPDGSGIDFIRSARESSRRDVIVLTGNGSIDSAVQAMKEGAFDYLLKPLRPAELGVLLQRLERKREVDRQLREQETRFRALIEHSSDAIALLSADGEVLYASPSTARVLGRRGRGLVGGRWLDQMHPDDAAAAADFFAAVLADRGRPATIETRLRARRKGERWIEMTMTNLLGEPSVGAVVVNYRDVTERRRAIDELEYRAFHDELTGLPNRALFLDRLTQAIALARRDGRKLAVMFIDLDRLKGVNDTLGHSAGDAVIRAVTERLRGCVREADTLARVGGDEFTLLIPEITDEADAVTVAAKTLASVAEPFPIRGREVAITTSIGIGFYPRDGGDPESLMACADRALYRAKETGRNRYRFCSALE